MTDGISDEKFKEEMRRLMKFAVLKIGENSKEIALLRKTLIKTRENRNISKKRFVKIPARLQMRDSKVSG